MPIAADFSIVLPLHYFPRRRRVRAENQWLPQYHCRKPPLQMAIRGASDRGAGGAFGASGAGGRLRMVRPLALHERSGCHATGFLTRGCFARFRGFRDRVRARERMEF